MSRLTKQECDSFVGCYFSSACMGIGSILLRFLGANSEGIDVAVTTKFEWRDHENHVFGDGTNPSTTAALFPLLNLTVIHAQQDELNVLQISFEGQKYLKIVPDKNGLESYVVYMPGVAGGIVF